MNKVTFYVILLHGLLLGISMASAELPRSNRETKALRANQIAEVTSTQNSTETSTTTTQPAWKKLPSPQVWVINQDKKVQSQPFTWVVKNIKLAQQQPFLEVGKPTNKPETKPNSTVKPSTKDDLESFDEVVKDTEKKRRTFHPLSQSKKE